MPNELCVLPDRGVHPAECMFPVLICEISLKGIVEKSSPGLEVAASKSEVWAVRTSAIESFLSPGCSVVDAATSSRPVREAPRVARRALAGSWRAWGR